MANKINKLHNILGNWCYTGTRAVVGLEWSLLKPLRGTARRVGAVRIVISASLAPAPGRHTTTGRQTAEHSQPLMYGDTWKTTRSKTTISTPMDT